MCSTFRWIIPYSFWLLNDDDEDDDDDYDDDVCGIQSRSYRPSPLWAGVLLLWLYGKMACVVSAEQKGMVFTALLDWINLYQLMGSFVILIFINLSSVGITDFFFTKTCGVWEFRIIKYINSVFILRELIRYQMLFRDVFYCKHVERQLCR